MSLLCLVAAARCGASWFQHILDALHSACCGALALPCVHCLLLPAFTLGVPTLQAHCPSRLSFLTWQILWYSGLSRWATRSG